MDKETTNEVNKNILVNNMIGVVTFILFVVAHGLKSVVLLSMTVLVAITNVVLILKYFKYARNHRFLLDNYRRVKRETFLSLFSAIAFIVLSIILFRVYIQ